MQEGTETYVVLDFVARGLRHCARIQDVSRLLAMNCGLQAKSVEETWGIVRDAEDTQLSWIVTALGLPALLIPWNELASGPTGDPLRRLHAGAKEDEQPPSTTGTAHARVVSLTEEEMAEFGTPTNGTGEQEDPRKTRPGPNTGVMPRDKRVHRHPAQTKLFQNMESNPAAAGLPSNGGNTPSKRRRDEGPQDGAATMAMQDGFQKDVLGLDDVLEEIKNLAARLKASEALRGAPKADKDTLGEIGTYTGSAARKWSRVKAVLTEVDQLFGETAGLKEQLEEKDRQIAELRDQLTNGAAGLVEAGVEEKDWGRVAALQWPNDLFKTTIVQTSDTLDSDVRNLVVVAASGDTEGAAQLLGLGLPNATKAAVGSEELTKGEYAKITSRETTVVNGEERHSDSVTYVAKCDFNAEEPTDSIQRLTAVMTKVFADMPKANFTFCTRAKGVQAPLRKIVELHGRRNGTENTMWYGRRKKKTRDPGKVPESTKVGQQAMQPPGGYAGAAARGSTRQREEFPALGAGQGSGDFPALGSRRSQEPVKAHSVAKKPGRPRRPAVIVQAGGKTFGEITRQVREIVGDLGQKITDAGMTRDGNYRIEVTTQEEAQNIEGKLASRQLQAACRQPILRLVVSGLEESLSTDETAEELKWSGLRPVTIRAFDPNKWGKRLAFCDVEDSKEARDVLAKGSVRIGYGTCYVRPYRESNTCFKCHAEGHRQQECTSTEDYSRCCRTCKIEGHFARECPKKKEMSSGESSANANA